MTRGSFLISLFLLTATSRAATPALLIGPDLKPREVKLQAVSGGKLSYFDDERRLQVESAANVLQIRIVAEAPGDGDSARNGAAGAPTSPPAAAPAPTTPAVAGRDGIKPAVADGPKASPPAVVDLIDGQRIVARFTGTDADGQKLTFDHAALGVITANLDKISRLFLDGSSVTKSTPAKDQVILANGDALDGFIAAVKKDTIELQQDGGKSIELPTERVKALLLANPIAHAVDPQSIVWLRDGSRLIAAQADIEADKLQLRAALAGGKALTLPLAQVARLELPSRRGRLIDLADLPMTVKAGGVVFGLPMPPRVEAGAIRMHAPITVQFALPAGAGKLAAVAEVDAAGESIEWADFAVNCSAGDAKARVALSAAQPRGEVLMDLFGPTLTISLDPAANGPVMDRLRLREAMVFVQTPAGE